MTTSPDYQSCASNPVQQQRLDPAPTTSSWILRTGIRGRIRHNKIWSFETTSLFCHSGLVRCQSLIFKRFVGSIYLSAPQHMNPFRNPYRFVSIFFLHYVVFFFNLVANFTLNKRMSESTVLSLVLDLLWTKLFYRHVFSWCLNIEISVLVLVWKCGRYFIAFLSWLLGHTRFVVSFQSQQDFSKNKSLWKFQIFGWRFQENFYMFRKYVASRLENFRYAPRYYFFKNVVCYKGSIFKRVVESNRFYLYFRINLCHPYLFFFFSRDKIFE